METSRSDLRETSLHMEYTLIDKSDLRFFTIHNDSRVIALDSSGRRALFYDALHLHKEEHKLLVQVPKQTCIVQHSSKALLCITESNDLYYDILFLVRFTFNFYLISRLSA